MILLQWVLLLVLATELALARTPSQGSATIGIPSGAPTWAPTSLAPTTPQPKKLKKVKKKLKDMSGNNGSSEGTVKHIKKSKKRHSARSSEATLVPEEVLERETTSTVNHPTKNKKAKRRKKGSIEKADETKNGESHTTSEVTKKKMRKVRHTRHSSEVVDRKALPVLDEGETSQSVRETAYRPAKRYYKDLEGATRQHDKSHTKKMKRRKSHSEREALVTHAVEVLSGQSHDGKRKLVKKRRKHHKEGPSVERLEEIAEESPMSSIKADEKEGHQPHEDIDACTEGRADERVDHGDPVRKFANLQAIVESSPSETDIVDSRTVEVPEVGTSSSRNDEVPIPEEHVAATASEEDGNAIDDVTLQEAATVPVEDEAKAKEGADAPLDVKGSQIESTVDENVDLQVLVEDEIVGPMQAESDQLEKKTGEKEELQNVTGEKAGSPVDMKADQMESRADEKEEFLDNGGLLPAEPAEGKVIQKNLEKFVESRLRSPEKEAVTFKEAASSVATSLAPESDSLEEESAKESQSLQDESESGISNRHDVEQDVREELSGSCSLTIQPGASPLQDKQCTEVDGRADDYDVDEQDLPTKTKDLALRSEISSSDMYLETDIVNFVGRVLDEDASEIRSWTEAESTSATDSGNATAYLNETRGGSQDLNTINASTVALEASFSTLSTANDESTTGIVPAVSATDFPSDENSTIVTDVLHEAVANPNKTSALGDEQKIDALEQKEDILVSPLLKSMKLSRKALEVSEDKKADASVSIVTWNLAEESPSEEDAAFIKAFRKAGVRKGSGSDLVLISAQECENIKPRRSEGRRSREYRRLMIKMLGKDYVPIVLHLLGGIQFGLFAKRSFLNEIEDVTVADVTCGIGNVFHNKGAICAFLTVKARNAPSIESDDQTPRSNTIKMAFVTAHMAAHVKNSDARDADFWRISSELEAQAPDGFLPDRTKSFAEDRSFLFDSVDRAFFCGDLNYRVDLPREVTEYAILTENSEEAWHDLLKHDQLFRSMTEGRSFPGFAEGKITFAPTFKFDKDTGDYDTSHKQRIPAWTDRILFKAEGTRVLSYRSVPSAQHSDHRPVFGTFRVNMEGRELPESRKRRHRPTRPSKGTVKNSER